MRVLGLDIGDRRIGVAVSDPAGRVSTPVTVLDARQSLGDGVALRRLLSDYEDVESIVVGLPRSLDGSEGVQATRVRATAARIGELTGLEIRFVDERLSSAEAERRMAECGADSRARRGSVDMVAASILLQAYLDAQHGEAR